MWSLYFKFLNGVAFIFLFFCWGVWAGDDVVIIKISKRLVVELSEFWCWHFEGVEMDDAQTKRLPLRSLFGWCFYQLLASAFASLISFITIGKKFILI